VAYLVLVRSMRELVERFTHRFRLWQRERYGDYSPADPTAPRNPLRFVALVAVMSMILDATEPFVFHRAFDVVAIVRIPVAIAFLILYQSKSPWAWHLVVAWMPLGFFAYWALRLAGYSLYQPRVHRPVWDFVFALVYVGILAVVFVWLLRVRQRYFRYIEDPSSEQT
jgi:hypothetical protein